MIQFVYQLQFTTRHNANSIVPKLTLNYLRLWDIYGSIVLHTC